LDVSQRASATAGCAATFKLRAMPSDKNYQYFSMPWRKKMELRGGNNTDIEQSA
jgi:hypothetical protein